MSSNSSRPKVSLPNLRANSLGGPTGTAVADPVAAVIFLSCRGSPGQVTSQVQVTSPSPPEILQVAPIVKPLETRDRKWNSRAANFRPECVSVCVCVSKVTCGAPPETPPLHSFLFDSLSLNKRTAAAALFLSHTQCVFELQSSINSEGMCLLAP